MKNKYKFISLLAICTLISSCGISKSSKWIEEIKNSEVVINLMFENPFEGYTYEELAGELAGAKGTVEWSTGIPQNQRGNSDAYGVIIQIKRNAGSSYKNIEMHVLVNTKTGAYKQGTILIDGERQSPISFAMTCSVIGIENETDKLKQDIW